jgi:hypothetical protein
VSNIQTLIIRRNSAWPKPALRRGEAGWIGEHQVKIFQGGKIIRKLFQFNFRKWLTSGNLRQRFWNLLSYAGVEPTRGAMQVPLVSSTIHRSAACFRNLNASFRKPERPVRRFIETLI